MEGDPKSIDLTATLNGKCKSTDDRINVSALAVVGKTNFSNNVKVVYIKQQFPLKCKETKDKNKPIAAKDSSLQNNETYTTGIMDKKCFPTSSENIENCREKDINILMIGQRNNTSISARCLNPSIVELYAERTMTKEINRKQYKNVNDKTMMNIGFTDNNHKQSEIVNNISNIEVEKNRENTIETDNSEKETISKNTAYKKTTCPQNFRDIYHDRNPQNTDTSINSRNQAQCVYKGANFNYNIIRRAKNEETNCAISTQNTDKEVNRKNSQIIHNNKSNNKTIHESYYERRTQENYVLIDGKDIDKEPATRINKRTDTDSKYSQRIIGDIYSCRNIQFMSPSVKVLDQTTAHEASLDEFMLFRKPETGEKSRDLLTIDKEIEEIKKVLEEDKLRFIGLNGSFLGNSSKTWKPIQMESVPLINVTATLKEHRILLKNSFLKTESDFDLCFTPEPIQVTGHAILTSGNLQNTSFNGIVPNNSARSEDDCIEEGKEILPKKEKKIAMKVYDKWKTFVQYKKITEEIEEQKVLTAEKKLLGKYFKEWKCFWIERKLEKRKLTKQRIKEKKLADLVKAVVIKSKELKLENQESEKKPITKEAVILKSKVKNNSEVYENRYKALLKIVVNQKEKLEKQEEIIGKLNEEHFLKESNKFIEKSKQEAEIAIENYDRRLKTKAKIIKQKTESEITNENNCHTLVQSMMQRAKEIKQANRLAKLRRMEMEERKRLEETELENMKKLEKEQTKKMEKIERVRQKDLEMKKLIENQSKQLEIKQMILAVKTHYKQKLIKKCFHALKKSVDLRNQRLTKVQTYYENRLKMKYFNKWLKFSKNSVEHKMEIANQYYKVSLLQKYWKAWLLHHEDIIRKKQVSSDLFEFKLQLKYFRRWCVFTSQQYLLSLKQMEDAWKHYNRRLIQRTFKQWKQFTKNAHLDREQELRRQSWRHKVKEILPDFCPILSEELET